MVTPRIDAQAIKQRIDLVDLASRDVRLKKIATTRGGEWAGPCPFCGGRDRFRVQPKTGLWFCRQCSPDGRWQDAIAFFMRRDSVGFAEACRILGASSSELGESVPSKRATPEIVFAEDVTPTDAWRARAAAFVEECEAALWSDVGARARAYLAGRGLQEETLRGWCVGFHDADRRERASSWGLEGEDVWLPRGVTLPWLTDTSVWQVKIRRTGKGVDHVRVEARGGRLLVDGLNVAFIGRVGQGAELRWTQSGTPLVNVSVLVQDSKAAPDAGQWIRVGHFGDKAEDLAEQLVKGTEVYVEGRLKLNTWLGADGAPRSGLNVTAWKLEPIGTASIGRRGREQRAVRPRQIRDPLEAV